MSRHRTIEFTHDTGKDEELWRLEIFYWPESQTWRSPDDKLVFEIQEAVNLDTGEILSEPAFYKMVGKDGRLTVEAMMMDAEQDDYEDHCDRKYDEWRDRQMEEK